jgi:hypothetical protein
MEDHKMVTSEPSSNNNNVRKTKSLITKNCSEYEEASLPLAKSKSCQEMCEVEKGNTIELVWKMKQHEAQFEEPTNKSITIFVEDGLSRGDHQIHHPVGARPSLRSWFSLVANMSNRPSIFS